MQRDNFKKLFGYDAKDLTDNINQSVYYEDEEKPVYEENELQEILKGQNINQTGQDINQKGQKRNQNH